MEFRLTYEGALKANAGPVDKQILRRHFHAQLKILWEQIPLTGFKELLDPQAGPPQVSIIQKIGPFLFAPLVCEKIHLICELEITLLRPEPPGSVITQSGDIDNRLKTLFDGLRMPKDGELVAEDAPKSHETPFFCLLEDDNLITKVTVATDRLLRDTRSTNEVLLVIRVNTKATQMIYKNMGLG